MRFKHRFKSCLWSRTDIWGNLLTKKKSFLRPKWDSMMGVLESQKRPRRVQTTATPNNKKARPPHPIVHDYRYLKTRARANQVFKMNRWGYRNTLSVVFRLRRFYGDISHKSFKAFCRPWFKMGNPSQKLLGALEGRLDICLYRLGFFHSIFYSRQAILHHKVLVNGKVIGFGSYVLEKGDFVEFCPEQRFAIQARLLSRYKGYKSPYPNPGRRRVPYGQKLPWFLQPTPKWIQTDYSNLSFMVSSEVCVPVMFPFRADVDEALWSAKYGFL
uniref:Ribosomal protein S4 n=1 Tax=Analipus japonicus TaxID=31333 RepID=A0A8F0FD22_9PHAE|nr:ribosomal protein S4 [Analipus japonicus]